MAEIDLFTKLKLVNAGRRLRYPRGSDPLQIMSWLQEECGGVAEQVNLFEGAGVNCI